LSIKSGQPPSADLLKYLDTFQGAVSSTITWTESSLAAIKEQKGFVDNLVDALKGGLGTLVDADVGEKSVELESAKAAQQLTLQGLSVANTSPPRYSDFWISEASGCLAAVSDEPAAATDRPAFPRIMPHTGLFFPISGCGAGRGLIPSERLVTGVG
jgi:hypothetical protein